MSLTVMMLLALSIVLDVVGQLCFKLGVDRLPQLDGGFRLRAFWGQVFNAPLLWAGIGAYVIEFFVWLEALSRAPLSLLFPLAALAYCLVVLAGRVVLKETVSRRRWLGTLVITFGVMLVAIAGGQA
ncbi:MULTISPECIES: EamA family transporter [unclassified Pseudomonas]|uniref:EamA family transporter n=1 Tax=unclassified Pseudomonas TaxID=196821 RepID=UPI000F5791BE|nr:MULTISPECIES: EamA family transporter [unclassified Pseudomonas]AZF25284.1 Permease of the drug/metabolite transporter (DMT) superfamily [Pseudomonas sp. R2-60-08W]AZF30608.1 Permease of the drug/metabolite transporter (DMT) superfamily [Pseudomonas sp. R4-35-07]